MKDLLVIVRAGRASLHPEWRYDRDRVDLLVSAYSADAPRAQASDWELGGYNKFSHVADLIETGRVDTRQYRWLFLVDDDIEIRWPLERLADELAACNADIAQPGLAWGSFHSFSSLLRNPLCRERRISLVEVMCPAFRSEHIDWLLPAFRASRSTWGIDLIYSKQAQQRGLRLMVLDRLAVRHCKEINLGQGAWYAKLRADGVDAQTELNAIEAQYGRAMPRTLACEPLLPGGRWLAQALERIKPGLRRKLQQQGWIAVRRIG